MEKNIFCIDVSGTKWGPIAQEEIAELIKSGKITPVTIFAKEDKFHRAGDVPGLFKIDKNIADIFCIDKRGHKTGPFSSVEIRKMARLSTIKPDTILEQNGSRCKALSVKNIEFLSVQDRIANTALLTILVLGAIALICLLTANIEQTITIVIIIASLLTGIGVPATVIYLLVRIVKNQNKILEQTKPKE
ncbi:MAG: hypothetical protein Q4G68_11315 [Planctomycetia bacterium]|nr:hypothetical protein [Planctomycetia bacterium]